MDLEYAAFLGALFGLVIGYVHGKAKAMGVLKPTIDALNADKAALQARISQAATDVATAQANAVDPTELAALQQAEADIRALAMGSTPVTPST